MVRQAQSWDIELRVLQDHAARLREQNPMLGHRGCRLAVSWPEIYDMQATSVFEAMHRAQQDGVRVQAELLIPLVSDPERSEEHTSELQSRGHPVCRLLL